MRVTFYTGFSKKKNSTKKPDSNATSYDVSYGVLKQISGIMNPIISFQGDPLSPELIFSATYAHIPKYHRYYFVKDWVWNNGVWDVIMEEDVLASFRTQIGESEHYILRSADVENDHWNPWVCDTMYPVKPGNVYPETVEFSSPFVTAVDNGVYIVGVIGSDSADAVGAITYYAMTPYQFGHLKATLFGVDGLQAMGLVDGNGNWTSTDVGEQFFKTMYNPFQYIASCFWFPVSPSSISGSAVSHINIGWWVYSVTAIRISQKLGTFYDGINHVPAHPLAYSRGDYLSYAPYTELTLHGKFGSIPINTLFFDLDTHRGSQYQKTDVIIIKYTIDYITGQCLVQIYASMDTDPSTSRKQLITKTQFLIGVPIQLAQIGMDYLGSASTAVSSITGTIKDAVIGGGIAGAGGAVAGAISGGLSGIYNTLQSSMPQMETSGSNGSFINLHVKTELSIIHKSIVWEDLDHKGRPYCLQSKIKFLSGYTLCSDGETQIECMDDERDTIARYLTTGFYWE